MTNQIKLNFKIDYNKSELEEGLEKMLGLVGSTLSKPNMSVAFPTGECARVRRKARVGDVNITYDRFPDIYNVLNDGHNPSTNEWVTVKHKNIKFDNGYAFNLDNHKNYITDSGVDFSVNDIAPRYNGILTSRYFTNEDGTGRMPRITKKRFVDELYFVLKEHAEYKSRIK